MTMTAKKGFRMLAAIANTITPRERPILFSGPMVRAILEGRKTQTRRVVKPQPVQNEHGTWSWTQPSGDYRFGTHTTAEVAEALDGCCPYGNAGDRLWVREAHYVQSAGYRDGSGRLILYRATEPDAPTDWTPSIHMPRWASRITLEITGVRVERLQDMPPHDFDAEGMVSDYSMCELDARYSSLRRQYRDLWDSLNKARGFGWDANPWIWVLEFEVLGDADLDAETLRVTPV